MQTGDGAHGRAPSVASPTITAEFLYLPSREGLTVVVDQDTVKMDRRNSSDSCIAALSAPVDTVVRNLVDSLSLRLAKTPLGEHKKTGVMDGTRITIESSRGRIYCDNCLNDFVLQAGGMKMVHPSARLLPLRDAVDLINRIAAIVERPLHARRSTAFILTDPGKLTDTKTTYRIRRLDE